MLEKDGFLILYLISVDERYQQDELNKQSS